MSDPFRTSTADPQLSSRLPANIYQRADGLTLIHQEIEAVPVVVTDIWVDAGARHEYPEDSGLAHFLEHMIFKGTDRLSPGAFDCAIEGRGGATNAATSQDYAHFYITTADRDFEATLPDLCDLLLRAKIPDDEFELEREVVYEEIAQYRDNPDDCLFAATMASLYPASAYGRPVLGTRDRLESLTPETMRQFHRQYYQPHNMTVTIVGNVSFDRARDALERHCTDFRPPASYRDDRPVSAPPRQTQICRDILELPNLELARLNLAWHGPGVENLPDGYVLDAIALLLSGGRPSPPVLALPQPRPGAPARAVCVRRAVRAGGGGAGRKGQVGAGDRQLVRAPARLRAVFELGGAGCDLPAKRRRGDRRPSGGAARHRDRACRPGARQATAL